MSQWPKLPEWEIPVPTEDDYPEWHSVYTIQLGELIEKGYFDWERVAWGGIGKHTQRIKSAFVARYYFDEISMLPPQAWLKRLGYKLEYELTPKYAPLYDELEHSSYLQSEGEYRKSRDIHSTYPETLLDNENEAYASDGRDFEEEYVKSGNIADSLEKIVKLNSLDGMLLDELESMFIGLYTTHINGF